MVQTRDDQEPVEPEEPLGDAKALTALRFQLCHQAVSLGRGTWDEGARARRGIAALNLTQDVAGDRRRNGAAAAAVLHDDGDAIARPFERCVGDEERVVALLPREVFVLSYARAVLAFGDPPYLHAPGLAGHGQGRLLDARTIGGALGVVHNQLHALADEVEMGQAKSPSAGTSLSPAQAAAHRG